LSKKNGGKQMKKILCFFMGHICTNWWLSGYDGGNELHGHCKRCGIPLNKERPLKSKKVRKSK